MKYIKLFEEFSQYIGQCDLIRKKPEGNAFWHKLIANKINVSKEEFLSKVNVKDILDDDDTIEDFVGSDTDTYYAKSIVDGITYYFVSTYGFEFIWKC